MAPSVQTKAWQKTLVLAWNLCVVVSCAKTKKTNPRTTQKMATAQLKKATYCFEFIIVSKKWGLRQCQPARQTTESKTCDQFVLQQNVSKLSGTQELRKLQVCLTCSCQPSDLWKLQQLHGFHVILLSMNSATDRSLRTTENMQKSRKYAVFYAFLLRSTSASDLWELQYFHIFLQHWFPAILENCSPTELQCFHVFLLSVVSSNGLWEIQWYYNIFWTSLIFPLRKTVTRVLYRMIFGYHFAHKLTS